MTIAELTTFLGWSALINICFLLLATIGVVYMRGFITRIHGKLFALDEQDLCSAYFQYLAQYKIMIIVFNITPYLALRVFM
jgi:hypothetical protein